MEMRRGFAVFVTTILALISLTTIAAGAATPINAASHMVNLSRPLILYKGAKPLAGPNGISVSYSANWSGYAALPKTAGVTFTSIIGQYTVPSVACSVTPNTFSYHWIGLDGWSDQTVEQDGIAADCIGSTPKYAAWYEMYPANFKFSFAVHPGDAIESAVHYLGNGKYELSLKDVTSGQGFDVTRSCPPSVVCENSSAESITEAYYYNKRYAGTSDFGDEHYAGVTVTDSAGAFGGLSDRTAWKTGEGIALGEYGDVDTTPGPLSNAHGLAASSSFSVYWSREN
jgi:Peptidase A4 family